MSPARKAFRAEFSPWELYLKLSLRAKFLLLSGVVQGLVLCVLIWNSLRLMDDAVSKNAYRVAHEYAVTLNLSLSPYAMNGRLPELSGHLSEMLSDQDYSFVRYVLVADADAVPILRVGSVPVDLVSLFKQSDGALGENLKTSLTGAVLNVQAPLLLQHNRIGSLSFGVSTADLALARHAVLVQGSMISIAGFLVGLLLFYVFTSGIGARLRTLTRQSERIARGNFEQALPLAGGDELEVFSRSLNSMSLALRERIAQLVQAEQRLSESEARFKILFNTAPVPLTVTDSGDTLMATNLAWASASGHVHDSVLGKRSGEIHFWKDADEHQRIWDIYSKNGLVQGEIAAVRLANGRAGEVAIWTSSIVLDDQQCIVWAFLDMSEELNAKRELKNLNLSLESRVMERSSELADSNRELLSTLDTLRHTQRDLISAEKMASLGSLVAGVAHELNTPIGNSLLAATTLVERARDFQKTMEDGSIKRSALMEHLEDIKQGCNMIAGSLQRAGNLIASFKQVAVDQTNDQRRVFDLELLLSDTLSTFAPRLRLANCSVVLDLKASFSLDSYPGSLCQVMNNLINNALLHAFDDRGWGNLSIQAREAELGWMEIIFSDDGAGMPEHVLHRIFDPFFTTKMGQGGSGLGMNIVYNIVTAILGGRIEVASVLGQGTTIKMLIPCIAPRRDLSKLD